MAETFSVERRKLMRFLGAKVVLTPAAQRGMGMVNKAIELAKTHGWFLTRQFENEANADMHSRTTAREIVADFDGERLDYWVTGYGTGGTLKGVARVLGQGAARDQNRRLRAGRRADCSAAARATAQPGRLAGGRPSGVQTASDAGLDARLHSEADRRRGGHARHRPLLPIADADAMHCSRDLAQKEGIFVGITAGATFAGALQVCAEAPKGATVLCMLPDTGERYLSTPLFADIPADMNEEEMAISRSTPAAQISA